MSVIFETTDLIHLRVLLTLILLTTTIVAPLINASKWQMGFNSAFKGLNAGRFVDRETVALQGLCYVVSRYRYKARSYVTGGILHFRLSWFAQTTLLLTHSYILKYLKGTVTATTEACLCHDL
jgi:hypothetical protein